jgi:uncharacterized protein
VGPRAGGDPIQAGNPPLSTETGEDPLDESEGEPRIVAGRCSNFGAHSFPLRPRCPNCGGSSARILLPREGELWTWTIQGFEPKAPYVADGAAFEPYGVGYVEFPGYLRVEGRLTESDPSLLRIGMAMVVVAARLGGRRMYAFASAEATGE